MLHHKRARIAQNLVVNVVSSADGQSRVARGRLKINLFEWRIIVNLPIGNAIERDAARKAHVFLSGALMQSAQHFEQNFFQARL